MNNYFLKYKKHLNPKGLLLGVAVAWGMASMAAVLADIPAQAPLFTATGVGPNILFILDDSGSMDESYLPESLSHYGDGSGGLIDGPALSAAVNTIYFNPAITYTPPVYADGTSFPNAVFTAAWNDGYGSFESPVNLTTVDLSSAFQPSWGQGGFPFSSNVAKNNDNDGNVIAQPAYYYSLKSKCTAANDIYTKDSCYEKKNVEGDDKQRNFANWYSYYRTRLMMAKAGISRAFAQLGTTPRVGYGRISIETSSTVDGVSVNTVERGVRAFSGADRSAFFRWLFAIPPANDTPSRRALDSAGLYYSNQGSTGPWSSTPGSDGALLACRQSYTVFMTDGYWNGAEAGTTAAQANNDGVPPSGNRAAAPISGPGNPPFADAYSNTLADVAMYYWARDLCPSIDNQVPTSTLDPAFWQHIVTYGIGLGVPTAIDPAAAFAAIAPGTAIVWPDPGTGYPSCYIDNSDISNNCPPSHPKAYDRIDDLLHAAVNSRGGFFNVNNPDQFAAALNATLSSITTASAGSAASGAANSTQLNTGTQVYQALFDSKDWSGELKAFDVNTGTPAAGTTPAISAGTLTLAWEASTKLPTHDNRNIYTYDPTASAGSRGLTFKWLDSLTQTQQDYLDTDGHGQWRVNWLRGDQRHEQTTANPGGIFRARTKLLGDIVNSSPVYAGGEDYGYGTLPDAAGGGSYSSFLTTKTSRKPMLYVGANDGMLHGFDVGSGQEKFAYIPNAVFPNLSTLTSPTYSHHYYVDGISSVGDVYDGSWRTLLVGATGAGGRAVFALDVTNPAAFGASKVLWEFSNANDADLGYTLAQLPVVRLQNGTWAVIVANGYNSTNGHAVLFVLNALTGAVLKKMDATGVEAPAGTNGLSSPVVVDTNNDRSVDTVYAGDLYGNLWKFDLSGNADNWAIPGNSPLFVACTDTGTSCSAANRQPITGKPNVGPVGADQNGVGLMVYFGTGQYFATGDNVVGNNPQVQTFYGLWDKGAAIADRAGLQEQTITYEGVATLACVATSTCPTGTTTTTNPIVVVSKNPVCYAATSAGCTASSPLKSGWALDLLYSANGAQGERVVSSPIIRQGYVLFTTLIPKADPCKYGGDSHFMAVGALSGGESGTAPFGVNGDRVVDSNDLIKLADGSTHAASGIDLQIGIINMPTIIEATSIGLANFIGTGGASTLPLPGSGIHRSWRQLK